MCLVIGTLHVLALALAGTRTYFELTVPSPGMVAISILAGSASIGSLALCGYPLRTGPPPPPAT